VPHIHGTSKPKASNNEAEVYLHEASIPLPHSQMTQRAPVITTNNKSSTETQPIPSENAKNREPPRPKSCSRRSATPKTREGTQQHRNVHCGHQTRHTATLSKAAAAAALLNTLPYDLPSLRRHQIGFQLHSKKRHTGIFVLLKSHLQDITLISSTISSTSKISPIENLLIPDFPQHP